MSSKESSVQSIEDLHSSSVELVIRLSDGFLFDVLCDVLSVLLF